ncbi:MAG TPA: ABC transporter permease subunit [Acidimicrobiales bacterium]|jgi:NitT/TauT family transport system permease protein|nr:ABC transporter permease subunit [Acidimicrobiales bacterium]
MLEVRHERLQEELAGLDALELADRTTTTRGRRFWRAAWPKLAATVIALGVWQLVVWSGWKPDYVIPAPATVFAELRDQFTSGKLVPAIGLTLQRAAKGYAVALVLGVVVGLAVSRSRVLRSAFGSFITGLQTMPSVVWFPFALIVFKKTEAAIMFVVVLGAAPSIANGLISGIDQVPPLFLRAGRVLGAKRLAMYRFVTLPAALPNVIGGLKQGWAFAWRSLMAGELLVIIPGHLTVGVLMQNSRDTNDMPALMASMIVILMIGIFVDAVFFAGVERSIRRRRGLLVP